MTRLTIRRRGLGYWGLMVALAGIGVSAESFGQTWDGGGIDNNWTTANNWNPNVVPVSNGTANLLFAGNTRLTPAVNAAFDINSLTYNAGAGSFQIQILGGSLIIRSGGITNNSTSSAGILLGTLGLGGAHTWNASAGPLVIGSTVLNTGAGTTTIDGAFDTTLGAFNAPAAAVTKNGAGGLVLTNSFLAATGLTITTGAVRLNASNLLNDTQIVTIDGGTLDLQGFSDTVGAVTLVGGTITGTSSGILTGSSYDVRSGTINKGLGGSATLTKTTGGVVTISRGNNSLSGGASVNAGTLLVTNISGFACGSGTVTIASGATLGGTGIMKNQVQNNGTVAPGLSSGFLWLTGGSSFIQGATGSFDVEIGGTTGGSQYDQMEVDGPVTLAGTLNVTLINGFVPAVGDNLDILFSASRSGTFTTTNLPPLPPYRSWQVQYITNWVRLSVIDCGPGDCDGDGTGDACEQDCNGNGLVDECEIRAQLQQLVAADRAPSDHLGASVAISGDTAVVGAPDEDTSAIDHGAAYVFVRSGGVWTQQQKLLASDRSANDHFGIAVAISGDTILVGAYVDDHAGGIDAGSAYVFIRSAGVWTQQQKLTASDGAGGDVFGGEVAIHGETAVVGADLDDHAAGADAGSAYVFVRSGALWTQEQKLTAPDAAADDFFGGSVAVFGDTTVIGAERDSQPGVLVHGSAHVFVRAAGVWTHQQKLTASDASQGAVFGVFVSISNETAVVGSPFAAYVFVRSGAVWTEQQKLTLVSDSGIYDLAVSGDAIVIGAGVDDTSGINAGAAFVFTRTAGVWTFLKKLTASDAAEDDTFGFSIAVQGDTAVIGARLDDVTGGVGPPGDKGSAYVFGMMDCNGNIVPDTCETDTDGDGFIDVCDNLQLLSQPQSFAFCSPAMSSVNFTTLATGVPPVTYLWRRNGASLIADNPPHYTGVITSALTVNLTTYNYSDTYDCVVTHPFGTQVSDLATLAAWPSGGGNGNLSGTTEGRDIQGLVDALLTGGGPGRQYCIYDMNLDSVLDYGDIQPFLDVLLTKPLPINDACENALLVITNALYTGSTMLATTDGPAMSCEATCGGACNLALDVWYRWVADFTGTATFSMCDGLPPFGYDTMLLVYDGCPGSGGGEIGCNDDGCAMFETTSRMSASVTLGQTYRIRISGWRGAKGNFTLRVVQGP